MPPTRRYKVRDASNRLPPQHPNPYTGYNIMNFPYNQTKQRANELSIIPNKMLDLSFEIAKKIRQLFSAIRSLSTPYLLRNVNFKLSGTESCKPPFGCSIFAVADPPPAPSQGRGVDSAAELDTP